MFRLMFRKVVVFIGCLSVLGLGTPISATAGIIGTAEYLALEDREYRIERINAALMQDRVSNRLMSLGVDPADARQRVAALSDADLLVLDERIQQLPAGGGVLEVVLAVFLILLILDLAGITDIFPGIGPGATR